VNYFRKRHPGHPIARKLRNRVDRGGSVADQAGADSGSVDSELTDDAGSMFDFAQRTRKERELRLHGADVKARAAKRKST
jgi:hypothetical protein